jgi:signal transduction histidine kinase
VLGLDHHTAGKRLAEQWGLPQTLTDCIWLHGSPIDGLPDVPHRRLISLIRLADGLAREQHVGFSGNNVPLEDRQALVRDLGLDSAKVHEASLGLFEKLEELGQSFGIHDQPSEALSLAAMQKANRELSRLNQAHATKGKAAAIQKKLLDTITVFNALAEPGLSIADVLDHVATSAAVLLGEGELSVAYIGRQDDADHLQAGLSDRRDWLVHRYDAGGMPAGADYLKPPAEAADWVRSEAVSLHHQPVTQACPWLFDRVSDTVERPGRVIPLPCGWGNIALLIHHSPNDFDWQSVAPLAGVWGGAVAAAAQHEGAKRLGEQLAEANNALAEAQDLLLAKESLARLGEMAAGAAHEMNNPLSVISGRSQVLTLTLPDGSKERSAALAIFRESHRLSDLISCLHMFAEPPQAQRKTTDLTALLKRVIQRVQKSIEKQHPAYSLEMQAIDLPERVLIDEEQIDRAVTELLFNAVQASPKSKVVLNVRIQAGRQLIVQVIDDGRGMDTHTLQHAIDPFFSNKPAGRQLGMGLPRVQQLAKAHGGMVSLRSTPQRGTVATLSVPLDSPPQ